MSWHGHHGPPQSQGYAPPYQYPQPYPQPQQHPHHQAPYGAPPSQMNYPPHGGHSPYPPQGSHYPPPGAPYGAPPQAGFPQHPPSSFPAQHGHSPFPHQQSGYPPPQAPGQHGAGYPQQAGMPQADAEMLRSAMSGAGTNEAQLIRVLARVPDLVSMEQLRQAYESIYRRDLVRDLESETSGYFREALVAIARGPVLQDAHLLRKALDRIGTEESVLNDVLLGRTNQAIAGIKAEYARLFNKSLERDVSSDLSFETQKLFSMVLKGTRTDDSIPVHPQQAHDVAKDLMRATGVHPKGSTDQTLTSQILCFHSDGQIRAIAMEFQRAHGKPLEKVIQKNFSGHMKDAYLQMLGRAQDRAKTDAEALEQTMRGMGTDDRHLVNRLVRMHWNRDHFHQVKAAYKHFYHKELVARIKGETSGHYKDLLVAIAEQ